MAQVFVLLLLLAFVMGHWAVALFILYVYWWYVDKYGDWR